jgi:hypothetical protein
MAKRGRLLFLFFPHWNNPFSIHLGSPTAPDHLWVFVNPKPFTQYQPSCVAMSATKLQGIFKTEGFTIEKARHNL